MYWMLGRLQWCWAHLKRDFQALIDSGDRSEAAGTRVDAAHAGNVSSVGALSRRHSVSPGLKAHATDLPEVESLLLRGAFSGNPRMSGMCRELYEHRQWLWTFVRSKGRADQQRERAALRHA